MATIPEPVRDAVSAQLAALVRGDEPGLLTWVRNYGGHPATVVAQPDDIWSHPWSAAIPTDSGGWHVVVPLWTTEESPSDLSAEIIVDADRSAEITGVHVL
ncbi:MAG: hypothetical protein M3256_22710 [Actinomycetota bacterium]|nr:hypothetical protein [Actinomycetota bacterium]